MGDFEEKVKNELENKGFFAFDLLEEDFYQDLKYDISQKKSKYKNEKKEKIFGIFFNIAICCLLFSIFSLFIGSSGLIPMKFSGIFFGIYIFILFIFFLIYLFGKIYSLLISPYKKYLEKINRKVLIYNSLVFVGELEISFSDYRQIKAIILQYYNPENNLHFNKNFRTLFFQFEELTDEFEEKIDFLKNIIKGIYFGGEIKFKKLNSEIKKMDKIVMKILNQVEKIRKLEEGINLEIFEKYLKESIKVPFLGFRAILQKNLEKTLESLKENKSNNDSNIRILKERLFLQKTSLEKNILIIDEKIKNL